MRFFVLLTVEPILKIVYLSLMRNLIQQLVIFFVLASFTVMVVNMNSFNLNQTEEELVEEPIHHCPKKPNGPDDINHFNCFFSFSFHDLELEKNMHAINKFNLDQWANYKSPWIDTPFSPPEFKA